MKHGVPTDGTQEPHSLRKEKKKLTALLREKFDQITRQVWRQEAEARVIITISEGEVVKRVGNSFNNVSTLYDNAARYSSAEAERLRSSYDLIAATITPVWFLLAEMCSISVGPGL